MKSAKASTILRGHRFFCLRLLVTKGLNFNR
jgi:hypothetical protein